MKRAGLWALSIVAAFSLVGCKRIHDATAYYACKRDGHSEAYCRQADAEARLEATKDRTPPRVVNVCVRKQYGYHHSICVETEQRCVWGQDYEGPKVCDVIYPE